MAKAAKQYYFRPQRSLCIGKDAIPEKFAVGRLTRSEMGHVWRIETKDEAGKAYVFQTYRIQEVLKNSDIDDSEGVFGFEQA